MASNEIVDLIRERTDIVEIIGEVVRLIKRGSNFIGLCPFHEEKTPSFTVSQDKGIYKCFGCGVSGNVYSFMMNFHGFTFPEALNDLARRAGIVLPNEKKPTKEAKEAQSRTELVLNALSESTLYFKNQLKTTAGKVALSYIRKRNFTDETVNSFQLGYSPDSFDALSKELKKKGFLPEITAEAGLTVDNEEKKSVYDRFRGRLMFPIHNVNGKVIAFGARRLNEDDSQPKYLNSPQTPLYDKSRTLYGLWHAKNEIRSRGEVILVEGYADVITLHQAGFRYAVASSGTSLTTEQLDLLSKYCKKLIIAYDSDKAGIKAADRAVEMALERGFEPSIVRLPDGEDPDSIIKNQGSSIFSMYLKEAENFIDFKYRLLKQTDKIHTPQARTKAIREILAIIIKIPDRLQHDDYITYLANLFNLSTSQVQILYKEKQGAERNATHNSHYDGPEYIPEYDMPPDLHIEQNNNNIDDKSINTDDLLPEEELLIQVALINKESLSILKDKYHVTVDKFISQSGKRLYSILLECSENGQNIYDTISSSELIHENDRNFLTAAAFSLPELSQNWSRFGKEIPENEFVRTIGDALLQLELTALDNKLLENKEVLKTLPFDQQISYIKQANEMALLRLEIREKLNNQ